MSRAICAALPACAAVVVSAAIIVSAAAGINVPFWQGGSLTLSEAAALRDSGEVLRLILSGADPNTVYSLRPGVLAASSLTPLEAAVSARRAEIVELLFRHGARVDGFGWRHLHCLAVDEGAGDVVERLDRYKPATAAPSCEGINTRF